MDRRDGRTLTRPPLTCPCAGGTGGTLEQQQQRQRR